MTSDGYIKKHPGTFWWQKSARKVIDAQNDSFVKDHSKFSHLMQAAFAEHEFTAEYTDHIIDFCESGGEVDPKTQLRFGRKASGGAYKFDVTKSGVNGEVEM